MPSRKGGESRRKSPSIRPHQKETVLNPDSELGASLSALDQTEHAFVRFAGNRNSTPTAEPSKGNIQSKPEQPVFDRSNLYSNAPDGTADSVQRKITLESKEAKTVADVTSFLTAKQPAGDPSSLPKYAEAVNNLIESKQTYSVVAGAWGAGQLNLLIGSINAERQKIIDAEAAAAEAAKEKKLKDAFTKDAHKVITLELLRLYFGSTNWRLRVVLEFDDTSQDGTKNFGVCFEIRDNAANEVMYTHFHAHHNTAYTTASAHFKSGRSNTAPQSWDLSLTTELVQLIKFLRAQAGGSYKVIGTN